MGNRAGERHALAFAAGEGVDAAILEREQLHLLQELARAGPALVLAGASDPEREDQFSRALRWGKRA